MKLETDSRVHAQAYIHKHTLESPCPVACALIRNLLDDLYAANSEIRSLQCERSQLQRRITEQYGALEGRNEAVSAVRREPELVSEHRNRSKEHGHNEAAPEARRPGNSG